jgi:hypothetical protein
VGELGMQVKAAVAVSERSQVEHSCYVIGKMVQAEVANIAFNISLPPNLTGDLLLYKGCRRRGGTVTCPLPE